MPKVEQLTPTSPTNLKDTLGKIDPEDPKPLVAQLENGILGFTEALFGGIERGRIYAQKFLREPKGRGAHFDVYGGFIDEAHPGIGVYNLTGHASLRAFVLSRKLQEYYDGTYPEPTDDAFEARRKISHVALSEAGLVVMEAKIKPATGMVFPQFRNGRHLVHEVTPTRPEAATRISPFETAPSGSFIKVVIPKDSEVADADFRTRGYRPLDQFIEEQLAGVSYEERDDELPPPPTPSLPTTKRRRQRKPSALSKPTRSCNYD